MKMQFNIAEKGVGLIDRWPSSAGHGFDIRGVWNPEIHAAIGAWNRALHKQ